MENDPHSRHESPVVTGTDGGRSISDFRRAVTSGASPSAGHGSQPLPLGRQHAHFRMLPPPIFNLAQVT